MADARKGASGGIALLAVMAFGAAAFLYGKYSTLVPCEMLQAEVKNRVMDGDVSALSSLPDMVSNGDDQAWCAQELARLFVPE